MLHLEKDQELFVCIAFGVDVHLTILSMFKSTWQGQNSVEQHHFFFVSLWYKKPLLGTPKGPQYANRLEVLIKILKTC